MADSETWASAIIASIIVSLLSLVGLFLLPLLHSTHRKLVFTLMICFAAGALLGDAFFHLIPETFHLIEEDSHDHGHDHDHDHDHNDTIVDPSPSPSTSTSANARLIPKALFKAAMKASKLAEDDHDHDHDHAHEEEGEEEEEHSHANSVVPMLCLMIGFFMFFLLETYLHSRCHDHGLDNSPRQSSQSAPEGNEEGASSSSLLPHSHAPFHPYTQSRDHSHSHGHSHSHDSLVEDGLHPQVGNVLEAPPIGLMMILSDGLHNFVDGLAIGSAFSSDFNTGIATTLAIVAHEIPAELGEMAVLLSSGYSKFQAVCLNLLSGSTSLIGAIIGVVVGENIDNAEQYILPIVAGGFIYISCVDLLSGILNSHGVSPILLRWKLLAIWVGIAIMIGITYLE